MWTKTLICLVMVFCITALYGVPLDTEEYYDEDDIPFRNHIEKNRQEEYQRDMDDEMFRDDVEGLVIPGAEADNVVDVKHDQTDKDLELSEIKEDTQTGTGAKKTENGLQILAAINKAINTSSKSEATKNLGFLLTNRTELRSSLKAKMAELRLFFPVQFAILESEKMLRLVEVELPSELRKLRKAKTSGTHGSGITRIVSQIGKLANLKSNLRRKIKFQVEKLRECFPLQYKITKAKKQLKEIDLVLVIELRLLKKFKTSENRVFPHESWANRLYADKKKETQQKVKKLEKTREFLRKELKVQYKVLHKLFPLDYSVMKMERELKVVDMGIMMELRRLKQLQKPGSG